MTDRVTPASRTPAPPAPKAVRADAPVERVAQAPVDGLSLGARQPAIEADLQLAMRGKPVVDADGTVRVRRDFLLRFVKDVLRDPRAFSRIEVQHEPARGTYAAVGVVRWHGIPLPIAMDARPVALDGQLGVRFERPRLRLGFMDLELGFMTGIAQDLVLQHLRSTRIRAAAGSQPGTIRMEPSSLLHELGVMPDFFQLDATRSKVGMQVEPNGDVTVALGSPTAPPPGPRTPKSDVVLAVDEAALQDVFARVLAPDYQLATLRLREDGVAVTGKANLKPLSDGLTAAKGLLMLLAIAGGNGRTAPGMNADAVVVMGQLDLDARVTSDAIVLKPSMARACDELVKMGEAAGVPVVRVGDAVRIDLAGAAAKFGAELRQLQVDEHGVSLRAGLDVEKLIRNRALLAD